MLYMCFFPDIQEKVHAEIQTNIGLDEQILLEDKPKLPYLNAVVQEITRMSTTAVGMATRAVATENITVSGYDIAKGRLWRNHP